MKFEVKVTELTENDIATIISGASYGVSYWCSEITVGKEVYEKYRRENDTVEDVQARAIKDGNPMVFTDIEDGTYYLTYDSLLKGVQKFIESGRCVDISNIFIEGNEDSDDMDSIIQYSIFGKIVFS